MSPGDQQPAIPSWWLRALGNFAVQRPFYVLGALVAGFPFTAIDGFPGHAMLGNLFVEYYFTPAFWLGFALFGAVWAIMLTACLNLDGERDLADRWTYNLPRNERRVTVPVRHVSTFIGFTLLGLPGVVVTIVYAEPGSRLGVVVGLILGAALAYLCMDVMVHLTRHASPGFRILPWKPLPLWDRLRVGKLAWSSQLVSHFAAWVARHLGLRDHFFTSTARTALKPEYFFAVFSMVGVIVIYLFIYRIVRPGVWTQLVHDIDTLPPAGFIYALLLPLIWIVSALWFHLRRYRIMLPIAIVVGILLYGIGSTHFVESKIGGPAHTYSVYNSGDDTRLTAVDVLAPLQRVGPDQKKPNLIIKKPNLIIVAASGGGILASGWTTKVLAELNNAYPDLWRELRLISAVSGGSVGAAHYVSAQAAKGSALTPAELERVVDDSMATSLAVTAYGFAFPDFRRALFPLWTDEEFDRGRLAEAQWRKRSNDRRGTLSGKPQGERVVMSDWRLPIREGTIPAVIFNATVMETGERIALTPLSSMATPWGGWRLKDKVYPDRFTHARTLSEFLGDPKYTLDVWTAARVSATFSYVSPAARASFAQADSRIPAQKSTGLLHLIDGGYNDNSGVASALDWLSAALEDNSPKKPPFSRVALVEIRAKPFGLRTNPSSQWEAAWLGPVYGLMNSWGYAQTAADDTAVFRMSGRFKTFVTAGGAIPLESFVFVPSGDGPLSWHLSKSDKDRYVRKQWENETNPAVLQEFLRFVKGESR